MKKLRLTRKSGKATISCDFRSSQPLSTVVGCPDDYRQPRALRNEGKKGVCIGIEVVYDLEEEEEDLIEKDSDDVMLIAKKARNVRLGGLH